MIDITMWEWPQYAYLALTLMGVGMMINTKGDIHMTKAGAIFGSVPAWIFLIAGGFFN